MKYIGPPDNVLKPEIDYDVKMQKMYGRIFEPGKTEDGKHIDTVGKRDNRIMVWIEKNFRVAWYQVFQSEEEIIKSFEPNKSLPYLTNKDFQ